MLSSMAAAGHMHLLNFKLIKIELKLQLLSHTSGMSRAWQPLWLVAAPVARGCCAGQCRCRTLPSLQEAASDAPDLGGCGRAVQW